MVMTRGHSNGSSNGDHIFVLLYKKFLGGPFLSFFQSFDAFVLAQLQDDVYVRELQEAARYPV